MPFDFIVDKYRNIYEINKKIFFKPNIICFKNHNFLHLNNYLELEYYNSNNNNYVLIKNKKFGYIRIGIKYCFELIVFINIHDYNSWKKNKKIIKI